MAWNSMLEASCKAAGHLEAAAEYVRRAWEPHPDIAESVKWAREMIRMASKALDDMELFKEGTDSGAHNQAR